MTNLISKLSKIDQRSVQLAIHTRQLRQLPRNRLTQWFDGANKRSEPISQSNQSRAITKPNQTMQKFSAVKKPTAAKSKQKGFVLYEGASVFDGAPIVVIATLETSNAKTGAMVQTWILRCDIEPHQAIKTGDDSSVCGNCPQRHHSGRCVLCYDTSSAPLSVYRSYKRGLYTLHIAATEHSSILAGRALRTRCVCATPQLYPLRCSRHW